MRQCGGMTRKQEPCMPRTSRLISRWHLILPRPGGLCTSIPACLLDGTCWMVHRHLRVNIPTFNSSPGLLKLFPSQSHGLNNGMVTQVRHLAFILPLSFSMQRPVLVVCPPECCWNLSSFIDMTLFWALIISDWTTDGFSASLVLCPKDHLPPRQKSNAILFL